MVEKQLKTVKEAAEYLNCSTNVVREMIWSGQISYVDINRGGTYIVARFTKKHLEDFIAKGEVKAG